MASDSFDSAILERHVGRWQVGDPDAANALLRATASRLERLARRMLRDYPIVRPWTDTDDVLQNGLVGLMDALRSEQPRSTREFFNLAAEHIRRGLLELARKHGRSTYVPLDTPDESDLTVTHNHSAQPGAPVEDDFDFETWARFHEAVDLLPEAERELIGLVFYHGLTQDQAAELLNLDRRTVRRRWNSATRRLSGYLELVPEPPADASQAQNGVKQTEALPHSISCYRVTGVLGRGGMGVVYKADDMSHHGHRVAIKVLRPDLAVRPDARERFLRETRAAAKVRHDNIVSVLDTGEEAGAPYIVMPLLLGETLENRLRRHPSPSLSLVLKVATEVTRGLAAIHSVGLIHRDVKPANVWLEGDPSSTDADAGVRRVLLMDFGLARVAGATDGSYARVSGTPGYMSPEQARGDSVDARSDLFSLGCVLYRMTTGRPAFEGLTLTALLDAVGVYEPPPPADVSPSIPQSLSDCVMRLLSKSPAGRPASAEALSHELALIEKSIMRDTSGLGGAGDRITALAPSGRLPKGTFGKLRRRFPLLAPAWAALEVWFRTNRDRNMVQESELAGQVTGLDAPTLATALELMSREKYVVRTYRVRIPGAQVVSPEYGAWQDVPVSAQPPGAELVTSYRWGDAHAPT